MEGREPFWESRKPHWPVEKTAVAEIMNVNFSFAGIL
jgi:hypothetical protein